MEAILKRRPATEGTEFKQRGAGLGVSRAIDLRPALGSHFAHGC